MSCRSAAAVPIQSLAWEPPYAAGAAQTNIKKTKKKKKELYEKEVANDTTEIQRIIRDHYEKFYANKMDNLEEMENFLEVYDLLRLN